MTTQQPKQLSPLARFEKTIVATDASPFSADAVKVAIAMCAKSGAHLYPFAMVLTNPEYEALAPELVRKPAGRPGNTSDHRGRSRAPRRGIRR